MSSVAERPGAVRDAGPAATLGRLRARLGAGGLELAAYAGLLLLAAGLRFWDLGSRALHHDESLHAQFSWYFSEGLRSSFPWIFDGALYHHDPLMHGTFLFHVTAFTFLLLGDSDYTARVPAALFGTLLVAMPFLFRGRLGRVGALAAAAMLALSPTLLYFSRFARNDIWVAAFTLAMVIGIWRYLDEGRPRWLYLLAGALALSFASKETTYMTAAVFVLFVNFMVTADLLDRARGSAAWSPAKRAAAFVALAPVAWLAVALWPAIEGRRSRLGLDGLPRSGHVLLVLGTLTLPQFAAGVQVPLEAMGVNLAQSVEFGPWLTDKEHVIGWTTILTLLVATAAIGLAWSPRVWGIAFLAFFGIFAFLYTTMFTWVPEGIYSGFWRGLDYWLAQHDVQRGGQPVFYYLMLLPVYEFLPLALALGGGLVYILRGSGARAALFFGTAAAYVALVLGGPLADRPLVPTLALLAAATYAFGTDRFRQFLAFWLFGSVFAFSVAGEKMPWLLTHLALPAVLLAAVVVDDFVRWLLQDAWHRSRLPVVAALAVAGLGALVALLLVERRDGGMWLAVHAGAVAGVAGLAMALRRAVSPRWAAGLPAAALVGLLSVFSVRAAYMASFPHGDVPVELLVYTQTSPNLVDVRDHIDRLAAETGQGRDLPMTVDATDSFSWPWAWYLRHYRTVTYPTVRGGPPPPYTPVMIMNAANAGSVAQYGDLFSEGERFPHRWWFPEDYKRLTLEDFWAGLLRGERWRTWWDYWMWRRTPSPIGSIDAVAYFPSDGAQGSAVGGGPLAPREEAGSLVIGRLGTAPGALNQPAGVAVGADGSIYVADTHNHRIQKFDPDGRFVAQVGAPGGAPSQFQQPWGLAVDARGFVYVADTWNHRIQKFDPDLRYVTSWGQPAQSLAAPGPYDLYGPRGVAVDGDGNVLVTDTGNKRVLRYAPDGTFLGGGGGPGVMNEPVGLAVAPNGDVLVADTWNGRVLRLDSSLAAVAEYAVRGWESQDLLAKPYLALLPDGRVVLTAPAQGVVNVLSPGGGEPQTLTAPPGGGPAFSYPVGVATDGRGRVYVVELGASRVRRFSLPP